MRIGFTSLRQWRTIKKRGRRTKSKIKATQKDVWADEEIDMLLDIFSSETIQSSLETARSPKDKSAIYHSGVPDYELLEELI